MVTIMVYAEGGIVSGNDNARTISNSAALREELNRFLSGVLDYDEIRIVVKTSAGYKNAALSYIRESSDMKCLYVDLDRKPECRNDWFDDLDSEDIVIPQADRQYVFFWIQEMEAWFLKQPDAIERWAQDEQFELMKQNLQPISEEEAIKGKDIERLQHKPSYVLANILRGRYYSNELDKNNKRKKLHYGKLAHAPGIISHLDGNDLKAKDAELSAFVSAIKTCIQSQPEA